MTQVDYSLPSKHKTYIQTPLIAKKKERRKKERKEGRKKGRKEKRNEKKKRKGKLQYLL
jgi:hypothetical protein